MKGRQLFYLATPYSDYPGGLDVAARDAARVASILVARGVTVFSPVTHSHAWEIDGVDRRDQEWWLDFLAPFLSRCDGIIVAKMRGWDRSKGVATEMRFFAGVPNRIRSVSVHYASDAVGAEIVALGAVA